MADKAWTDKKEFKRLHAELRALSRDAFADRALGLLRIRWPECIAAPRLRKIDQQGVDLFVWEEGRPLSLAVQCKGFEVSEERVGVSQRDQCLASIRKFRESDVRAERYLLVHNRIASDADFRIPVEAAVDDLKRTGRVADAMCWDSLRFLREVFNALSERISAALNAATNRDADSFGGLDASLKRCVMSGRRSSRPLRTRPDRILTFDDIQVRPADGGRRDPDQRLAGPRPRPRHVFDPDVADAMKHGCAHGVRGEGFGFLERGDRCRRHGGPPRSSFVATHAGSATWRTGGCEGGHRVMLVFRDEGLRLVLSAVGASENAFYARNARCQRIPRRARGVIKTSTTLFKQCACGTEVALVPSKAGNLYPVDISEVGTMKGARTAIVEKSDFHRCAWYEGLSRFLLGAIQSGARRLKMRLLTIANNPVVLKWNGRTEWVYVTDGGPQYASTYYGKIDVNTGGFVMSDAGAPPDVRELLSAVSDHPVEAASGYGRATRECCFCQRSLDDERSIQMGWGRDCARRYGLTWGEEGEDTKKRAKRTRKAVKLE